MAGMWRVTHQVNLPTIALGILWIIHSVATTMYVPWQNSRQRAALASVVRQVDQALQLHDQLTELGQLPSTSEFATARTRQEQAIVSRLKSLEAVLDDPHSRSQLADVKGSFD